MIEFIVEIIFSVMDFAMDGSFFLYLTDRKCSIKRFLIVVLTLSFVQEFFYLFDIPRWLETIRDILIINLGLLFLVKDQKLDNYIYALQTSIMFVLFLSLGVTFSKIFYINIQATMTFGLYRIVFTLCLKLFILLCMIFSCKILKKINIIFSSKIAKWHTVLITICFFLIAYVMQLSELNYQNSYFMILSIIVVILLMYVLVNYSISYKKDIEFQNLNRFVEISNAHVLQIILEQKNIKELVHDMKNQLEEIRLLSRNSDFEQIEISINSWLLDYAHKYPVSICNNVYIDALVQNFMKKHPDVTFEIKINVPETIDMDIKDLSTLLMCLLCDDFMNDDGTFVFQISVNEKELDIHTEYPKQIKNMNETLNEVLNMIVKEYSGQLLIYDYSFEIVIFLK